MTDTSQSSDIFLATYGAETLATTTDDQPQQTPEEWANDQLYAYLEWCKSDAEEAKKAKALGWESLPGWWRVTGSRLHPHLATVFKALLSAPGSAAILERDFSIASNLLTVRRSQLDHAYVEMTMFLRMNMDLIPPLSQIPSLGEKASDAIPRRLSSKEHFEEIHEMDPMVEQDRAQKGWEDSDESDSEAEDDEEIGGGEGGGERGSE